MSVERFKVGDKVRVRKDLKVDRVYGEYLFTSFMERLAGEISVLLLPGVVGVDGDFESGSVIEVVGAEGLLARGICRYSAADLREVFDARREGTPAPDHVIPVIHRDNLAELPLTSRG